MMRQLLPWWLRWINVPYEVLFLVTVFYSLPILIVLIDPRYWQLVWSAITTTAK